MNEVDWTVREMVGLAPTVYLCGTITPDPKHLDWREEAERALAEYGIHCLSPVRGKNPVDWTKDGLEGAGYTTYSNGGFVARDERDIRRCDAVLLYFVESPGRQSIGTWAEFGLAYALGKPIIVVSGLLEVKDHPFVYQWATRIEPTLEKALEYLIFLLR